MTSFHQAKQKHPNSCRRSATEIKQIIDLYESGLSLEQVGEQFGISKQRVKQILDAARVKTRKFTRSEKYVAARLSQQKILPKNRLIELYTDKKMPVNEIIKELKTNGKVFHRSLEFHNIPKREQLRAKESALTEDVLRRLYLEENVTALEIARRLGYAAITIRKRLSKLGIKRLD